MTEQSRVVTSPFTAVASASAMMVAPFFRILSRRYPVALDANWTWQWMWTAPYPTAAAGTTILVGDPTLSCRLPTSNSSVPFHDMVLSVLLVIDCAAFSTAFTRIFGGLTR